MSAVDSAVAWAVNIARDNSHGYDQIKRQGPDYDCSSLVINAYEQAGVKVKEAGATYTGNMRSAFTKCGFEAIAYRKGMALIKGDVLLNEVHHTALYIGDGQIVQASINEKGTTTGGKTGDQTGKEIAVGPFYEYSKGWQYVLRLLDNKEITYVDVKLPLLKNGTKCPEVGTVQTLLNALGYVGKNGKRLTVDHSYGNNTEYAVKAFQKAHNITPDGMVGAKTYPALFGADY